MCSKFIMYLLVCAITVFICFNYGKTVSQLALPTAYKLIATAKMKNYQLKVHELLHLNGKIAAQKVKTCIEKRSDRTQEDKLALFLIVYALLFATYNCISMANGSK